MRKLDPHQVRMVEFLRACNGNALIFADAGTAKSYAALTHCRNAGYKSILIFCPKTAKANWANEIRLADCDPSIYTIENYEALLAERGASLLKPWDCIIADECHRVSHWTSKQTKRFHKLRAAHRIALSGTPWKNKIWEAHSIMHWIEPGCLGRDWWEFRSRFLVMNPRVPGMILSARDEPTIQAVIDRLSIRVSRDEPEVKSAMNLPDLHSREERFDLTDDERRAVKEIRDDALLTLQTGEKLIMANVLVALTRTRQAIDDPQALGLSVMGTKELTLFSLLVDKRPTIIYSPFATTMERLAKRYNGYMISGSRSESERNCAIAAFQEGKTNLLFITAAGGEAINLTRADRVIFYSLPYSWADIDQVTSRAHRRGRVGDVERVFLIANGSADEKLLKLVEKKKKLTTKDLISLL